MEIAERSGAQLGVGIKTFIEVRGLSMKDVLYRFRSIYNLLDGYHELENQEIYFASPEELNDPMEGFKDIYWSGDTIVWENILNHYVLCLEHCCALVLIAGDSISISEKEIPVFTNIESFPTQMYTRMYSEIYDCLIASSVFSDFASQLSQRQNKIRRHELIFHLNRFHWTVLESIFAVYELHHLIPKGSKFKNTSTKTTELNLVDMLNKSECEHPEIEFLAESLCHALSLINIQSSLILRLNTKEANISDENKMFIFAHFPEAFVKQIEKIVYPQWYAACFMSECSNSSLWGHYGNNHKGVCLIFKSGEKNNNKSIQLKRTIGFGSSGPIVGQATQQFYKVDYDREFVEIDFFRSLGSLPIPILTKYWYTNRLGELSKCADDILTNEDAWRIRHWQNFMDAITTKKQDWRFEQEYRLILDAALLDFSEPEERKIKYNFADLAGIIFGINTSVQDKLSIMRIINNKCKAESRTDFKFFQAYYSREKGMIAHAELSLLKFEEMIEKETGETGGGVSA
jgi:hypothetical protein